MQFSCAANGSLLEEVESHDEEGEEPQSQLARAAAVEHRLLINLRRNASRDFDAPQLFVFCGKGRAGCRSSLDAGEAPRANFLRALRAFLQAGGLEPFDKCG